MRPTINMRDSIFTASGGGKTAFVSVEDVAQAAFNALVAEKSAQLRDPIVVGPQLYSFDEVRCDVPHRPHVHNSRRC